MDINRTNYESFFLLYLDRELNVADRQAVENFLQEHADLQKEFSLLQQTIQLPAELVFEQKESLYHREGKRRFIPIYGLRIAAGLALILTAGWYMMTVLKNHEQLLPVLGRKITTPDVNHTQTVTTPIEPPTAGNTRSQNLDQAGPVGENDLTLNNKPERTPQMVKKQKQNGKGSQRNMADDRKIENPDSLVVKAQGLRSEPVQPIPEDGGMAAGHSNTAVELQSSVNYRGTPDPGTATIKAQMPALLVAATGKKDVPDSENSALANGSTENAISVIALNDKHKAIAGFFKKLTRPLPADETADNNKKLRVSVFQFSY